MLAGGRRNSTQTFCWNQLSGFTANAVIAFASIRTKEYHRWQLCRRVVFAGDVWSSPYTYVFTVQPDNFFLINENMWQSMVSSRHVWNFLAPSGISWVFHRNFVGFGWGKKSNRAIFIIQFINTILSNPALFLAHHPVEVQESKLEQKISTYIHHVYLTHYMLYLDLVRWFLACNFGHAFDFVVVFWIYAYSPPL